MSKNIDRPAILVTGANGQLGSELRVLSVESPYQFVFTDIGELDLTRKDDVFEFFSGQNFDFCINCAAYTAVDKAESDRDLAYKINALAVENLALACEANQTTLIHISTDFVFDGRAFSPLNEDDDPKPISIYGQTKLDGEKLALATCTRTLILRTSWLYSTFGNNFVKTMLRLAETRPELNVVFDQVGTPTYAADLAKVIVGIIEIGAASGLEDKFGIYHYSNEGMASWYDFAKAIFEEKNVSIIVNPILTSGYPLPAKRPPFSVMDKSKIKTVFGFDIPHWRESLRVCLSKMEK
ncbi:MAG: dTDP-4-dehydrorhamnose reductase [Cyclobacteriaceae bacterium]|nr:dTDP-4-dehydrorhamnose reductase [Cyclobacteriaceae bacterium]